MDVEVEMGKMETNPNLLIMCGPYSNVRFDSKY